VIRRIDVAIAVSWSDRLDNWDDDFDKGVRMGRKFLAELFGTAVLGFFAVGVATLMFGFKFDGGSAAAGVLAPALTGPVGNAGTAGVVIGLTLTVVRLIGIPLTGTSVNPARSLGPALIVGAP
jgi:glycerol uptake facilitator-like aquaporin